MQTDPTLFRVETVIDGNQVVAFLSSDNNTNTHPMFDQRIFDVLRRFDASIASVNSEFEFDNALDNYENFYEQQLQRFLYPVPPPLFVRQQRRRRKLVLKEGQKAFYHWKTVKHRINHCHSMCSICGEEFADTDQVVEGAAGQWYHRKELTKWIRQPINSTVRDPNTNTELEVYVPPLKRRKTSAVESLAI